MAVAPTCGSAVAAAAPCVLPRGNAPPVGENDLGGEGAASAAAVQHAGGAPCGGGGGKVVNVPRKAVGRQRYVALVAREVLGSHRDGAVGEVHIGFAGLGADVEVNILRLQELPCRAGGAFLPLVLGDLGGGVGLDRPLVLIGFAVAVVVQNEAAVNARIAGGGIGEGHAVAESVPFLSIAVRDLRRHGSNRVQLGRVGVGGGGDGHIIFIQCVARTVGDVPEGNAVFVRKVHPGDLDLCFAGGEMVTIADGDVPRDELRRLGAVVIEGIEIPGGHLDRLAARVQQICNEKGVLPVGGAWARAIYALQTLVHVDDQIEAVAHAQVQVAVVGVALLIIVCGAGAPVGLAQRLFYISVVAGQLKRHIRHIGRAGVQRQIGVEDGLLLRGIARKVGDVAGGGRQAEGASVDLYIWGDGEAAAFVHLLERERGA